MLVDSHVNLHGEHYQDDLNDVLARAAEAGVGAMLTISDRLDNIDAVAQVAARAPNIWRSVGVHPHHAKDFADLDADLLCRLAEPEDVIGIGETGLDFHYEYSPREEQKPVFLAHIEAARRTGLPLIIHTREADDAMAETLRAEMEIGSFRILMHCYSSGAELARAALDLDAYFAFSGILTFKNATEVRDIAKAIPLNRLLVETDCPYLAPPPHRGRRNEPAYLTHVAQKLAEVKEMDKDEIAAHTTENFFTLFERAERPL